MELKLVRHLWGVPNPFTSTVFSRFKGKGYAGIELYLKEYVETGAVDAQTVRELCDAQDFLVILQVITEGNDVTGHLDSLRSQLKQAETLKPALVNIHSGRDAFTEEESVRYFTEALKIEADHPMPFAHETHRGRILYNPWATRRMLERFADLKLVCDFSHWVCVCERLIDDQLDIVKLCAQRCHHLHARVGYACGPQVSDPRAPEFAEELNAHERWWDMVWQAQAQRGDTVTTLAPEFGPRPYQHELPYTRMATAGLEDICDWQALRQKERFGRAMAQGTVDGETKPMGVSHD